MNGSSVIGVEVSNRPNRNVRWCEQLYDERAAQLLLYGRALGLSHYEAEDVLHETFASLLALPSEPEDPGHYAFRAMRNKALNYKRSLWRRVLREIESVRWFEKETYESPMERAAIRCLAQLPAAQREVIVLKIWSEQTFEEIAKLLEISPNTVAGRYRYGLEKLRAALNSYDELELSRAAVTELETAATGA